MSNAAVPFDTEKDKDIEFFEIKTRPKFTRETRSVVTQKEHDQLGELLSLCDLDTPCKQIALAAVDGILVDFAYLQKHSDPNASHTVGLTHIKTKINNQLERLITPDGEWYALQCQNPSGGVANDKKTYKFVIKKKQQSK